LQVSKSDSATRNDRFESIFRDYFGPLCGFSNKYVGDFEAAKDIVHEVYISLWEKFSELPADSNYKSYLYTAVRNRSLNYLRDKKSHTKLEDAGNLAASENAAGLLELELADRIEECMDQLPEKCREIFELSRIDGLRYREIADRLNISIKTVENQMSKALRILKTGLVDYLTILIVLFLIFL
jgi:RNA polymerase sigma-70 factor (ECF subfamily)